MRRVVIARGTYFLISHNANHLPETYRLLELLSVLVPLQDEN